MLFDRDAVKHQLHSYFEGEADQAQELAVKRDGLSEDALLLWNTIETYVGEYLSAYYADDDAVRADKDLMDGFATMGHILKE